MTDSPTILIIGGGLSGLTAAYEISRQGGRPLLLEAADRLGGRIHSVPAQAGSGPFEMGATWFGEKHIHLNALLGELGVARFEQYAAGEARYEVMSFLPAQSFDLPYGAEPYFRIRGGSGTLIAMLMEKVGAERIQQGVKVNRLTDRDGRVEAADSKGNIYQASAAIVTVPPKLAEATLTFEPALPGLVREAMRQTHTWMSDSIKFWVEYDRPFWRDKGLAGMAMSQTGIVQEVHDHTNAEGDSFALMGFLSVKAHRISAVEREKETIQHLERLFGREAGQYREYVEKVWAKEPLATTSDVEFLSYHPGYGHPALWEPHWNGKLYFSGTETSPVYGGYMEGAVYAGREVARRVCRDLVD